MPKAYRPASSYTPGGAGMEAAITALEIELRAVRADLLAVVELLAPAHIEVLHAAPVGTWSQVLAEREPQVLWDDAGDEWRRAEPGVDLWQISPTDSKSWPLATIKDTYGPITYVRPSRYRSGWGD
jgi:hypothetical protein